MLTDMARFIPSSALLALATKCCSKLPGVFFIDQAATHDSATRKFDRLLDREDYALVELEWIGGKLKGNPRCININGDSTFKRSNYALKERDKPLFKELSAIYDGFDIVHLHANDRPLNYLGFMAFGPDGEVVAFESFSGAISNIDLSNYSEMRDYDTGFDDEVEELF